MILWCTLVTGSQEVIWQRPLWDTSTDTLRGRVEDLEAL